MGEEVPLLFQPLVETAITSNPRVFSIPYEMQRRDILPGEKGGREGGGRGREGGEKRGGEGRRDGPG